jgi:hypothetical protein
MGARMGAEAITTRIGAMALPLGVVLLVVAAAIHPSREEPMDNPAVFMEYAQSDSWVAVHFVQWFAALLIVGGLVALYYSITIKPEAGAGSSRKLKRARRNSSGFSTCGECPQSSITSSR